jgi:hypothetical protein
LRVDSDTTWPRTCHLWVPDFLRLSRYVSKEEARAMLDRRDKDDLYKFFVERLMPRTLQSPLGPNHTLHHLATLKAVYPDKPRHGGCDPSIIYPDDPYAAVKVDEDEIASGEKFRRNNPRKQFFPKGDWSTRIPGSNPFMPAVNGRLVRKLLEQANATALRQIEEDREKEKEKEGVRIRLLNEAKDEENLAGSEASRRLQIFMRWGTVNKTELNQ